MPLNVSTLISADFSDGSLKIAVLTLPVMTVSSTYSPVASCFGVEAQPIITASAIALIKYANLRVVFLILLPLDLTALRMTRCITGVPSGTGRLRLHAESIGAPGRCLYALAHRNGGLVHHAEPALIEGAGARSLASDCHLQVHAISVLSSRFSHARRVHGRTTRTLVEPGDGFNHRAS